MWPFSKKKEAPVATGADNMRDIEQINKNTRLIGVLLSRVSDEEITNKLLSVQDKLKYLFSSPKESVYNMDKEIEVSINEIELYLVKHGNKPDNGELYKMITELETKIVRRNAEI